ncbi:unnamed protein product [Symbiodinium sp. CCMP2592]|nr:unnamed protein product [Symbiodinium sp. CCMP2592]
MHSFQSNLLTSRASSAFDLLDWRLLDRALSSAGVPLELNNQILSWYAEITYVITHLGLTARVQAQQGLRQGCKLAPLLWILSLAQIYRDLQAKDDPLLNHDWLCCNSTMYADDIHLKDTMCSVLELDRMVHRFCSILDALRANGMVINLAKSAILLRHRGSFIKGWLRRHLIQKKDGNVLRLRSSEGYVYEIPIREQHTYLGIKISYHSPSRCAVASRLQAANQAWQRLRGVLCSTRHLALSERLQLSRRTTVLPTLLYGIAASSLEDKDIQKMQHMITKHLRAITKPYFLDVRSPQLLNAFNARHMSCTALPARQTAATLHAQVQQQWTKPEEADCDTYAAHQCAECHRTFKSFRLLRSHEATHRAKKTPAPTAGSFNRYDHGLEGLPTCRHCRHAFRQWDGLVKHIKRNRCQVLRRGDAGQAPLISENQPVQETLHTRQWTELLLKPDIQDYLQHHCPLCFQWLATTTSIKYHLTRQHSEWTECQPAALKLLVGIQSSNVGTASLATSIKTDIGSNATSFIFVPSLKLGMTGQREDPMELNAQDKLLWSQAGPVKRETEESRTDQVFNKRQRLGGQNKGKGKSDGKGKFKGKGRGGQHLQRDQTTAETWAYTGGSGPLLDIPWNATKDLVSPASSEMEWMEHRMSKLTQLVLRQEQMITALNQDMVLHLFIRSGSDGMIPALCDSATKWRTMKEESPEKITFSLKLAMFKQLLISLHPRLTETGKDAEAMERAKGLNWVDDQNQWWKHLKWNRTTQALEVDPTLRPIPTSDLLTQLVNVRKAVTEESPLRFK